MHRYHHALMMSIIFHTMKTTCKSASVLELTANRNDGALRNFLVECLSPLPHSGSNKSNVFGTMPIQQAPLELSTGNCQEYNDRKSTTERTLSAPARLFHCPFHICSSHTSSCFTVRFTFLFTTLVATQCCRCLLRSDYG